MKKRGKQAMAVLLSALIGVHSVVMSGFITENPGIVYADTYRQATVSATTLNVRSGPGTGKSIVKKLSYGAAVTVIGEEQDSAGKLWYKIRYTSGSDTKEGYASADYIVFPVSVQTDSDFERYMTQQGFPESYKESLRTLHAEHPTWIFRAQKTGLDWSDVIENEGAVGANLVGNSSASSWKSTEYGAYDWNTGKWTGFDGASWVAASEEIVCYYMDPRNFLNDTYIFQFLNHNYDSTNQTREGLQSMVTGTFLEKAVNTSSTSGGNIDYSGGPGAFSSNVESVSPSDPNGPGASSQNINSGGPGAGNHSVSTDGPGSSNSGATTVSPSTNTQTQPGGVQFVSPSGSSSGNVSLEGPSITVSAKQQNILTLPNVEYGPGMDASSITGDNTGASASSPFPQGQSYVDIIMKAAAQSGVNPYVLCAMIIQEQGKGTSGSISGNTAGYKGYYNFFNIGAYQAGSMSAVIRGLWYASQSGSYGRPWNSIEKSIVGGSQYYGDNYVKQGQDTFYLKKFNVQGSNLYKHQYMTNVEGAAGEGAKLARAYTDKMKNETLVFKIPVYNNMPETACAKPAGDGSPNNKLSGLSVTGYSLTPTFNMNTESYDIIVNPSVERIEVKASVLDSKASVTGTGTIDLQSGNNTVTVDVKAENGSIRTYKLNVVRQSSAPSIYVPAGSSNGPGGPGSTSVNVSGGPGAVNNVSSNGPGGPGAANSGTSSVVETKPVTSETSTAVDSIVSVVTPQAPGSGQDVVIGVAPGSAVDNSAGTTSIGSAPSATGSTSAPVTETSAPVAEAPAPTESAQSSANQSSAVQTTVQESSLKKGDCNGDGSVTILDLMLIKKEILGQNVLSGAAKTAADMNGDGKITSADATELEKKIVGQ